MAQEFSLSLKFGSRTFQEADDGVAAFVRQLKAGWSGSAKEAKGVLFEYLTKVAAELAKRHGAPWPGGTSPTSLSTRSGQSVQSILRSVKVAGTTWERLSGAIGGKATLLIHEYGGTIRANGKLLTIPLPAAMTPQGTSPPFARQWKNTFTARTKRGHLLVFQKRPTGIVPLYILVQSVRIRPRLGMREELRRQIPHFLGQAADRVAHEVLAQIEGRS